MQKALKYYVKLHLYFVLTFFIIKMFKSFLIIKKRDKSKNVKNAFRPVGSRTTALHHRRRH